MLLISRSKKTQLTNKKGKRQTVPIMPPLLFIKSMVMLADSPLVERALSLSRAGVVTCMLILSSVNLCHQYDFMDVMKTIISTQNLNVFLRGNFI